MRDEDLEHSDEQIEAALYSQPDTTVLSGDAGDVPELPHQSNVGTDQFIYNGARISVEGSISAVLAFIQTQN